MKRTFRATVAFLATLSLFYSTPLSSEQIKKITWQNPLPQGNSIMGLWGHSANDLLRIFMMYGHVAPTMSMRWAIEDWSFVTKIASGSGCLYGHGGRHFMAFGVVHQQISMSTEMEEPCSITMASNGNSSEAALSTSYRLYGPFPIHFFSS